MHVTVITVSVITTLFYHNRSPTSGHVISIVASVITIPEYGTWLSISPPFLTPSWCRCRADATPERCWYRADTMRHQPPPRQPYAERASLFVTPSVSDAAVIRLPLAAMFTSFSFHEYHCRSHVTSRHAHCFSFTNIYTPTLKILIIDICLIRWIAIRSASHQFSLFKHFIIVIPSYR